MGRQRWIAIAAGTLAVAVLLLVVVFVFRGETEMTPEDLARQWVSGNVDAVGEDIAGWMSAEKPVPRELGGSTSRTGSTMSSTGNTLPRSAVPTECTT